MGFEHPLSQKLFDLIEIHADDLDQNPQVLDVDFETFLKQCITARDIDELGLAKEDFPPIFRKLPRLYHRLNPSLSKIKSNFNSLAVLKKAYLDRAVHRLYSRFKIIPGVKIVIFTWIMDDGWGDLYTQLEAARILKNKHPQLHIDLVSVIREDRKMPRISEEFSFHCLDGLWKEPPPEILQILANASVIIQIPTTFPRSVNVPEWLIQSFLDKKVLIGEYGLIDRAWYHPKSHARAMGLHFLEKGIFIKDMPPSDSATLMGIKDKGLRKALFKRESPTLEEFSLYRSTHRFNLNYTKSKRGFYLYLHMLLKALEKDEKHIDVCFANPGILISVFETKFNDPELRSLFFRGFGIRNILIYHGDSIAEIPIASSGKMLRLIPIENLDHDDFLMLVSATEDVVGCTGDGSVSEAISAGKSFFYDPPYHKRSFLKDLIVLAEFCIPEYQACIDYLKSSLTPPECHLEDIFGNWATEDYILAQECSAPLEEFQLGEKLGQLLQQPDFHTGMSQLDQIIREKYCFNTFLSHLILRTCAHLKNPQLAALEKTILDPFYNGDKSCKEALQQIATALKFEQC